MAAGNLILRTVSGLVLAAVVVAAALFSGWTLLALCAAITAGSMLELHRLAAATEEARPLKYYPVAVGVALVALSYLAAMGIVPYFSLLALIPLMSAIFLAELYRKEKHPLGNIALSLAGIFYIAVPMALLSCMGVSRPDGIPVYDSLYPLGFIVLVWINDVGAYIVGMTVGRHRLFERISPKKSWEGFWGGVLFAVAAGGVIGNLTHGDVRLWLAIGLVTSLASVGGDLVESMIKRSAGVKDSGTAIPGHGGFLDRFDALFISIPFVYLLVKLLGQG